MKMESEPHWRRIWRVISGTCKVCTLADVFSTIDLTKEYLLKGLAMYPVYTEDSLTRCITNNGLDEWMRELIYNLSKALNLDSSRTWCILNNYLTYEYFGKIEDIQKIINKDTLKRFIHRVWSFYISERTYLLKILLIILENYMNTNHPLREAYCKFMGSLKHGELKESLFNQYSLLKESVFYTSNDLIDFNNLIDSKCIEIVQILLLIITVIKDETLTITEFLKIFNLMKTHIFMIPPENEEFVKFIRPTMQQQFKYCVNAIFILGLDDFWYNKDAWYSHIVDINANIDDIFDKDGACPILIAWATLLSTLPTELAQSVYDLYSHKYVTKALKGFVFKDLYEIVQNPIFQNCYPGRVVKTAIFDLFEAVCLSFDETNVFTHDAATSLFVYLLKDEKLAATFKNKDSLNAFYKLTRKLFPYKFLPYTMINESLIISKRDTEQIVNQLLNLKYYTELCSSQKQGLYVLNDKLAYPYLPFNNDLVEFEVDTPVSFRNQCGDNILQIKGLYSYFKIFRNTVSILLEYFNKGVEYEDHILNNVIAGYRLILQILKVQPTLAFAIVDIKHLLHEALCLIPQSIKYRVKTLDLLKVTFEIAVFVFKHDQFNIVSALLSVNFLPKSTNEFIYQFRTGQELQQVNIVQYIEEEILNRKSYDMLHLYCLLVKETLKKNSYYEEVQIPGCEFLLTRIFPEFAKSFSETFCINIQKIVVELIDLIYEIINYSRFINNLSLPIYNYVMDLFLNKHVNVRSLIKLFEFGNVRLQLLLITETNWNCGEVLKAVYIVKRSLQCVTFLLKHIEENDIKECVLLEEVSSLSIGNSESLLQVIVCYLNHCFDPEIPKIACNFLITLINVTNKPMLFSLSMGNYKIQHIFLDHLNDYLDDQEMKVAVIKFVTGCIRDQNSMTAIFFNILPSKDKLNFDVQDFIRAFIVSLQRNPNSLLIPLHIAILDLLHELWKSNNQHLLKALIDTEEFWFAIILPLTRSTHVPLDILLQILEIIILEMHFSWNYCNDDFNRRLPSLLGNYWSFFDVWTSRLLNQYSNRTEALVGTNYSLVESALTIWKNFVLSVRLRNKLYFDSEWNTGYAAQKCLDGLFLSICLRKPREPDISLDNCIHKWIEMFLLFIDFPLNLSDIETEKFITILMNVLLDFLKLYETFELEYKMTNLAVISKVTWKFKEFLENNYPLLPQFLYVLEGIFFHEYKVMFSKDSKEEKHFGTWILIMQTINTLLEFKNLNDFEYFFVHIQYVERLCEVFGHCLNNSFPIRVCKLVVTSLIRFARSSLSYHFKYTDLLKLTKAMLPPVDYIIHKHRLKTKPISKQLKDWWSIYIYIIKLNRVLLETLNGYVINQTLEFIDAHQSCLVDALLSCTTLVVENLELVIEILKFLFITLRNKFEWRLHNYNCYMSIMTAVKQVLISSIGVIIKPKSLIFVPSNPNLHLEPEETSTRTLVSVSNSLLTIISLSCKCLTRCNPPFEKLLDVCNPNNCDIPVECDFRIPQVINKDLQHITYGGLLCGLHFVCKVLLQQFFEDADMTTLNKCSNETQECRDPLTEESVNELNIIFPSPSKRTLETINSVHSFSIPDILSLQVPWLLELDSNILFSALNSLALFLGEHTFFTMQDVHIDNNLLQYIKRELCSELVLFYDFVFKYIYTKYEDEYPDKYMAFKNFKSESKVLTNQLLFVDIAQVCFDRRSGRIFEIKDLDDSFLITLVHWFRNVCHIIHYSKFDEFLTQWHAKSTCITSRNTFIKNTSVQLYDE